MSYRGAIYSKLENNAFSSFILERLQLKLFDRLTNGHHSPLTLCIPPITHSAFSSFGANERCVKCYFVTFTSSFLLAFLLIL